MRIEKRVLTGKLALLGALQPVLAAENSVLPGYGTLAIASASDGDTLLLGDGTYSGLATVDKSLILDAKLFLLRKHGNSMNLRRTANAGIAYKRAISACLDTLPAGYDQPILRDRHPDVLAGVCIAALPRAVCRARGADRHSDA